MKDPAGFAYEGDMPFIFVSYSHADRATVLPLLRGLQRQGFRLWYDAGIEHGALWQEAIAQHLADCHSMLIFLSDAAVGSKHCRNEIAFGTDQQKPMLTVYLEGCALTPGLQLQLGPVQALHRQDFDNDTLLLAALCTENILQPCRDENASEESIDPILDALGELLQLQEKKTAILVPKRLAEFRQAYSLLKTIAEENGALLAYHLHDPFKSMGAICLESADLEFSQTDVLIRVMNLADNMEVYPLTNGNIRMSFTFHGLTHPMPD